MNELSLAGFDFNWDSIVAMLSTTGVDFGIRVVTAIAIFYIGRLIVSLLTRGLHKLMEKQEVDKTLETFVCNLVRVALLAFVVVAAINSLGVQTASFIAVLGAAGLAVGLALQGSLSNFAAGVLIVMFRPYKVGDWIEAAGVSGSVLEVQILTTAMKTGDNKRVIVPNSQIMGSIITNYSAHDTRRVDLVVGVHIHIAAAVEEFLHLRGSAVEVAQVVHEVRVGQEAHVEDRIRLIGHAVFEAEAQQLDE
jgi:small conductance mechanosensitive channel